MSDIRPTSKTHPYPFTVVGTVRSATDHSTVYYVKNLETNKCFAHPHAAEPWFTPDIQVAHNWAKDCFHGRTPDSNLHEVPGR